MKLHKAVTCSIGIVFTLLVFSHHGIASDTAKTRATLRGLYGVLVLVDPLLAEIDPSGLTRRQIQTDVELKLRKAGIKKYSLADRIGAARPELHVSVAVIKAEGWYVYGVNVEFRQTVVALRTAEPAEQATTWSTSGAVGTAKSLGAIEIAVGDRVDVFINAFLSVNSKLR